MSKEEFAKMQVEALLAATLAALAVHGQYINPRSPYAVKLRRLQAEVSGLSRDLANAEEDGE